MKKTRKFVCVLLVVVFVVSLFGMVNHIVNYIRADKAYNLAKEIAYSPDFEGMKISYQPPSHVDYFSVEQAINTDTLEKEREVAQDATAEEAVVDTFAMELLKTDVYKLKQINTDVIGWICIPDTSISYPLIQGDDNSYYLDYSWEGMKNRVGSIYLDYRSSAEFCDFHSIIYGHRMYIDAMFNALKKYSDQEFLKAHTSVYILIDSRVLKYDVFSAYNAETNGPSWRLGLNDTEGQQALINFCLNKY